MPPVRLDYQLRFPRAEEANADGLVAVGGDLSIERLLLAYRSGIFPWTVKPISWWSPDPRGIFELETFHVPRRLAQIIRQHPYEVTRDRAFRAVMEGCAAPAPGRRKTWISNSFIEAYTALHEAGHAHSVECWRGDELVGGIYGVTVGGLFAGESMFHRADNASKIALVHLVEHLNERGFLLFDIQMVTPATRLLGAVEIPRVEYLKRLNAAVKLKRAFR
ncbi:MAG: Leu/Phe-tRNA-protein transferase [Verrucomicrobiota bacterium]|jgi:leucyl/phenylalanyl-tRNA--protein transferase